MDQNIDEYLVFLQKNASEIKSLGKQWGMDEKEIMSCVNEVLSRTVKTDTVGNSPLNVARKIWRVLIVFVKLVLFITISAVLLIVCLYTVAVIHQPIGDRISKSVQAYAYPIMRFIRLTALPLHDVANITDYYEAECIVHNPFFAEEGPDCRACSLFKKIKEVDASHFTGEKFTAFIHAQKPVLLKKTYERNITYQDVRQMYLQNQASFEEEYTQVDSNDPKFPTLESLFSDDMEAYLNTSEQLQIKWKSWSVLTSVAIRDVFTRPSYLPMAVEVLLEKYILLDSPRTKTYKMTTFPGAATLYTLGSGHRRVLLRPVAACQDVCMSILVIMEAGDSLLFSDDMYKLFISTNGDTPSVGYLMTFLD